MDTSNIFPITDIRRKFGEITDDLARKENIILTKGGRPFAILKSAPEEKRKLMRRTAGAWKNTDLDNDSVWKEVFKRKSRKNSIRI